MGNSIFLNKAPPQKLIMAPGAKTRGNTVHLVGNKCELPTVKAYVLK